MCGLSPGVIFVAQFEPESSPAHAAMRSARNSSRETHARVAKASYVHSTAQRSAGLRALVVGAETI